MIHTQPNLAFFCELDSAALEALFDDPGVLEHLRALGAGISMGLLDLSPERAAVVQRLNAAGIPLIAWLLLPAEQGYWLNINNAPEADARYTAFRDWTAAHGLRWEGVGLDVEFDMREIQALITDQRKIVPMLLRNLLNARKLREATVAYATLVQRIRANGYRVESYVIPFVLDERRVGATLLQRLAGLVDVPADREIPMLYTSFLRPNGVGILWSYAAEVRASGIGSTGGGVDLGGADRIRPLTWEELSRDLRLARHWHNDLYIFSLEGCVRAGYLERLRTLDWEAPIAIPLREAADTERFRSILRTLLWLSARPLVLLAILVVKLWLLGWLFRRDRSPRWYNQPTRSTP